MRLDHLLSKEPSLAQLEFFLSLAYRCTRRRRRKSDLHPNLEASGIEKRKKPKNIPKVGIDMKHYLSLSVHGQHEHSKRNIEESGKREKLKPQ